jgi:hypothetical protein
MARRRGRNGRAYSRSPRIAAPAARDHRHVSSIARLKPACSGCRMKTTRRLDESKSILISVLVARNARAKGRMGRFSMVVPGMQSRWCPRMTGKPCMASYFPMRHLRLQHKSATDKHGFPRIRALTQFRSLSFIQVAPSVLIVTSGQILSFIEVAT